MSPLRWQVTRPLMVATRRAFARQAAPWQTVSFWRSELPIGCEADKGRCADSPIGCRLLVASGRRGDVARSPVVQEIGSRHRGRDSRGDTLRASRSARARPTNVLGRGSRVLDWKCSMMNGRSTQAKGASGRECLQAHGRDPGAGSGTSPATRRTPSEGTNAGSKGRRNETARPRNRPNQNLARVRFR
jgi:hypothetical protein